MLSDLVDVQICSIFEKIRMILKNLQNVILIMYINVAAHTETKDFCNLRQQNFSQFLRDRQSVDARLIAGSISK